MIEHALRSLLINDAEIESLVNEKIYYTQAIQEVQPPYIVLTKVSATRVHSHDGYSNLANPRIQFSVFAETYLEGKVIARAIQRILQGYRGVSENVHIQMCLYMNEVDMYETQTGLHHVAVDYDIFHREIIPTPAPPYEYPYYPDYEKPYEKPYEYEKYEKPYEKYEEEEKPYEAPPDHEPWEEETL